jgi:hypothetical protein
MPRASPQLQKGSLTKTWGFALNQFAAGAAKNANSHLDTARENPEYNFLLHPISGRANLILDARSLF